MQDRLGRTLRIGELVAIQNHPEVDLKVNWSIIGFVDQGLAVEVILHNFISSETIFVNILDVEKEYY